MEALIRNIQASRNVPEPVLYLGGLQGNTDQYFSANNLHNQDYVPKAPAKIFNNYGATAEIDNRPFASLGLQVPRNPEQEALNEYFNVERIKKFASGQSNLLISEQLAKQGELLANQFVKDEIDRRAGIRRAVLEATGLTPAQIQSQMASEGLAGVNPRLIDMRDRQVQDAVNLYYNQNNIPVPVTTLAEPSTNIAPTIPQEAREGLPMTDAEAGLVDDTGMLANEQDVELTGWNKYMRDLETGSFNPNFNTNVAPSNYTTTTTSDPRNRPFTGSIINPYTLGAGIIDSAIENEVNDMTTAQLIQFIKDNQIYLDVRYDDLISRDNKKLKTDDTLTRKVGKDRLQQIVKEWKQENEHPTIASSSSSNLQKY